MGSKIDQVRALILALFCCLCSLNVVANEKRMSVKVPRNQCVNSLSGGLALKWWALLPPYFFLEGKRDAVDEIHMNLESFEENASEGDVQSSLFFLKHALFYVERLRIFNSISSGILSQQESATFAEVWSAMNQKVHALLKSHTKQIFDPLYSFGESEEEIRTLMSLAIFFQSAPEYLAPLQGTIPVDFLEKIASKVLQQISGLISEGESKISRLQNDSFAIDSEGTFNTFHPISKATETLGIRAGFMKEIFKFSLLHVSKLKKQDIDILIKVARQLIAFRPLALVLAAEAIDQKLVYRSFMIDFDKIEIGTSVPFDDLSAVYRLLRDLDTAEKFLIVAEEFLVFEEKLRQ